MLTVPTDVPLRYSVIVEPLRTRATWFQQLSVKLDEAEIPYALLLVNARVVEVPFTHKIKLFAVNEFPFAVPNRGISVPATMALCQNHISTQKSVANL